MAKRHRQPDPIDITSPATTAMSAAKTVPAPARRRTDEHAATTPEQSDESSDDISLSDHDELHVGDSTATDTTSVSANDAAVFDSDSDTAELEEDEMTGDDGNQDEDTDSVDLEDTSDKDDDDDDEGGDDSEDEDENDEDKDSGDDEAGQRLALRKRARRGRHTATHDASDDDDDDDNDEGQQREGSGNRRGVVTVDFGVYDFKASQIDAVLHLIDQFCPDHQNEVDRDAFGAMLAANPFTCVVRVNDEDEDGADRNAPPDTEVEIYGLASVLDLAHGVQSQAAALQPLYELLQRSVWRTAAPGLSPLELLMSTVDAAGMSATKPAKCVLLLAEYIRNMPLELTVCILEDLVTRLGNEDDGETAMVRVTHPCMYAILAKVQRAVEPPVSLQPATTAGHRKKAAAGKRGSDKDDDEQSAEAMLDMSRYIFWQEEKSVLYEFRDKRVATLVYRCRAQYDGQPAQEVPLSVLFVVQHGAMRQAIDEMKKRATAPADVTRY